MAIDRMYLSLLTDLLSRFKGSDTDYPRLPADRVACARSLLKSLVTDHDTVEDYMEIVSGTLAGATPPPDLAYERHCFAVIERGVDDIPPEALALLLLDPVGVMNIHLAVEQSTPSAWANDLAGNGRDLRKKYGVTSGLPHSSPHGSGAVQQLT